MKRGTVPVLIKRSIARDVAKWLKAGRPSQVPTLLDIEILPQEMHRLSLQFQKIARSRRGEREIRLHRDDAHRLWYWATNYLGPNIGNRIDRRLPTAVQIFAERCVAAFSSRRGNPNFRRYNQTDIDRAIPCAMDDSTMRRLIRTSRRHDQMRKFPTLLHAYLEEKTPE